MNNKSKDLIRAGQFIKDDDYKLGDIIHIKEVRYNTDTEYDAVIITPSSKIENEHTNIVANDNEVLILKFKDLYYGNYIPIWTDKSFIVEKTGHIDLFKSLLRAVKPYTDVFKDRTGYKEINELV